MIPTTLSLCGLTLMMYVTKQPKRIKMTAKIVVRMKGYQLPVREGLNTGEESRLGFGFKRVRLKAHG